MDPDEFLKRFESARKSGPHKPIMVLSIIDMMERGLIEGGKLFYSDDLRHTFRKYWDELVTPHEELEKRYNRNPALPFYHLKNDDVLEHVPREGKEDILKAVRQLKTRDQIQDIIDHAKIHEDLLDVLSSAEDRRRIMDGIVSEYFGDVEGEPGKFYRELKTEVDTRNHLSELVEERFMMDWSDKEIVRDTNFREGILFLYDHTCTVCKMRLNTPSGETVVDAAHILPFRLFKNNDLRNGMALCKTHHWLFDRGLLSIDEDFSLMVSPMLHERTPTEWMFTQFRGMKILLPEEDKFHPHEKAIEWHRENIFWEA